MKLYKYLDKKDRFTHHSNDTSIYGYIADREDVDKFNDRIKVFIPLARYIPMQVAFLELFSKDSRVYEIYNISGTGWKYISELPSLEEVSNNEIKYIKNSLELVMEEHVDSASKLKELIEKL